MTRSLLLPPEGLHVRMAGQLYVSAHHACTCPGCSWVALEVRGSKPGTLPYSRTPRLLFTGRMTAKAAREAVERVQRAMVDDPWAWTWWLAIRLPGPALGVQDWLQQRRQRWAHAAQRAEDLHAVVGVGGATDRKCSPGARQA